MSNSNAQGPFRAAPGALLCFLAVLSSVTADAQNLAKDEEGLVAVATCYASCVDKAFRSASKTQEKSTRLTELMISDEFFLLTDDSQDEFIRLYRLDVCLLAQNHVRGVDACYAGCVDVERAYGVRSSNARNRFYRLLREDRTALQDAGLWYDYRTFPVFGSAEFADACDVLYENGATAAQSRLSGAHAPSSLVNRLIRLEERLDRKPEGAEGSRPKRVRMGAAQER